MFHQHPCMGEKRGLRTKLNGINFNKLRERKMGLHKNYTNKRDTI